MISLRDMEIAWGGVRPRALGSKPACKQWGQENPCVAGQQNPAPIYNLSLSLGGRSPPCSHARSPPLFLVSKRPSMKLQLLLMGGALLHGVAAAPLVRRETAHGAVACESKICSDIGTSMLTQGGNAVDSIIATAFCVGVMSGHHSGIGGGGFALIRTPKGERVFYDFREMAPAASNETMYLDKDKTASTIGGLAVGVPGQILGFETMHKDHGRLPWAKLVEPSIQLARNGFPVLGEVASQLADKNESAFILDYPQWKEVYAPNGTVAKEGDIIRNTKLADTLQAIAEKGASAFYSGPIAESIVRATQERGGILTLEDLSSYVVKKREPLHTTYRGLDVYTCSPPCSGAVVLSDLNILEGFTLQRDNLTAHRLVEAMKFGYGQRTVLGDPDYVQNVTELVNQFLSKDLAAELRSRITDNATHTTEYYDPKGYEIKTDGGTSHMSSGDSEGYAAALTSTVNLIWGSQVMTNDTGIILNNQMDDFSTPGRSNAFGYIGTPSNYIAPGKRPLSSISTTIIERDGEVFLSVGAAGGSRIITAVLQSIINVVDLNMTATEAIAYPRLHDQILPAVTLAENSYDQGTADFLASLGHNVTRTRPLTGAQMVLRVPTTSAEQPGWEAAADPRKVGSGGSVV
ncbi:uncharacterized protein VTP21DRAFT_2691 [Calcarisporiella thermophila]|uniref:uncharacterized protein n=1 Tax=Calcarisporiella thermophila TaxID=911321 RepID=UPI0037421780